MPVDQCDHPEMKATTDAGVYLLMVYPLSNHQRFKNAMMKSMSILQNYTGSIVCLASEVKCVEGYWPSNKSVAVFHFTSEWYAKQYLQSDPVVKQPDFLDGIDVVIVHLKEVPPSDKPFFVIADVLVHDPGTFINEYSPKTAHMKEKGKVVVTAACPEPIKFKGTWKPNMIIINQWATEEEYCTYYNSDEYQPLKQLRQRVTQSNVISLCNYPVSPLNSPRR